MQTKQITIFENVDFGSVRIVEIDNEPWFVGKDVAKILGYAQTDKAIIRHIDEDDRTKYTVIDKLGRLQETFVINESGLYSLILSSKLPEAKKFKRWVTKEVLPSIRKRGMYLPESVKNNLEECCTSLVQDIDILHRSIEILQDTIITFMNNGVKSHHCLEHWKQTVGKALVDKISDKLSMNNQEVYKRIYSKMMAKYFFSISAAKAEFIEMYHYAPVSILDAIAANKLYCLWFEKSAEMLLGKDETVSLECGEEEKEIDNG